jgi:hypothetical protein
MNRLLLEYISKIISENSNILKEADPKKPGDVWDTGTNWAGKNQEGKIEYFPKTDPTSQQAAYAWARGLTGTQAPTGEPASADTSPTDEPQDTAQSDSVSGEAINIPKMGKDFKHQEIYDEFASVMKSGTPSQIQEFIKKYGMTFSPEKNTFYITLDGKGNKISGPARKIFGDGKGKRAGQAQKVLYDKLTSMSMEITATETSSIFAPDRVTPPGTRRSFGEVATQNSDGSITVTDTTGKATTYEVIDDLGNWVEDKFNDWLTTPEGQNSSKEEKRKMKAQILVVGFAVSERNRILRELLNGDEEVAMYDTPERQEEFVDNLESTIVRSISSESRRERVTAMFQRYKSTESPDEAAQALAEIISELKGDESPELKMSGAIPAIAEGFTAMVEMKRGRMVLVPLRSNFTATDVVSLATEETRGMEPAELVSKVKLIYVGISVKLGQGGSSSMIEKARLSIFTEHKETRAILDLLASKNSQQGSIFDTDESKRMARRQEIRTTIEPHIEEISKYYGFNPPAENVDQLIEWLGRGEPECIDGQVVPRRNPPPPIGKGGTSEAGKDPYGEDVDVEGWVYTWAAQGAYAAIYNSRVIGQAFASQTWIGGKRPEFREVDGITSYTKQIPQPLKQARRGSRGATYQPDSLATHNKPVNSDEELRSGNPCD